MYWASPFYRCREEWEPDAKDIEAIRLKLHPGKNTLESLGAKNPADRKDKAGTTRRVWRKTCRSE